MIKKAVTASGEWARSAIVQRERVRGEEKRIDPGDRSTGPQHDKRPQTASLPSRKGGGEPRKKPSNVQKAALVGKNLTDRSPNREEKGEKRKKKTSRDFRSAPGEEKNDIPSLWEKGSFGKEKEKARFPVWAKVGRGW